MEHGHTLHGPVNVHCEPLRSSALTFLQSRPRHVQSEDSLDEFVDQSSVLQQLRNIVTNCKEKGSLQESGGDHLGSSSTTPQRNFTVDHSTADGVHRQEVEICWQGNTLVWSAGGSIVRTFTFDEEVVSACWATFELDPEEGDVKGAGLEGVLSPAEPFEETSHRSRKVPQASQAAIARICTNILHSARHFSPAQRQVTAAPSTEPLRDNSSEATVRVLCISFRRSLVLHIPGAGVDLSRQQLSFSIVGSQVFPSPSGLGLVVVRAEEKEDRDIASRFEASLRQEASETGLTTATRQPQPLSTFFYLRRPYDDFVGIECFEDITFASDQNPSSRPMIHGASSPLSLDERLVFVSDSSAASSPSILITANHRTQKIRIYVYTDSREPLQTGPRLASRIASTASATGAAGTNMPAAFPTASEQVWRRSQRSAQAGVPDGTRSRKSISDGTAGQNWPPPRKSARLERRASSRGGASFDVTSGPHSYGPSAGRSRRSSAVLGPRIRSASGRSEEPLLQTRGPSYEPSRHHHNPQLENNHDEDVAQMVEDLARERPEDDDVQMAGPSAHISAATGPSRPVRPSQARQSSISNLRGHASTRQSSGAVSRPRVSSRKSYRDDFAGQARKTSGASDFECAGADMARLSEDVQDARVDDDADDEDGGIAGSSLFSRTWAAVALLEELDIGELQSSEQSEQVSAFVCADDASSASSIEGNNSVLPLIYLVLPFRSEVQCRELRKVPAILSDGRAGPSRHKYAIATPLPDRAVDRTPARAVVPLLASGRSTPDILLLRVDGVLELSLGPLGTSPIVQVSSKPAVLYTSSAAAMDVDTICPIDRLIEARDNRVTAVRADGDCQELIVQVAPQCPRTHRALQALDLFLDLRTAKLLRQAWIQKHFSDTSTFKNSSDWDDLRALLLTGGQAVAEQQSALDALLSSSSHLRHARDSALAGLLVPIAAPAPLPTLGQPVLNLRSEALVKIMYIVHALAQDASVDRVTREENVTSLALLCSELATRVGAHAWTDYWVRLIGLEANHTAPAAAATASTPIVSPPDVYGILASRLKANSEEGFSLLPGEDTSTSVLQRSFFHRTSALVDLFSSLSALKEGFKAASAQKVLQVFARVGVHSSAIDRFPLGLALPLKEFLRQCQVVAPSNWSAQEYELIDRMDLAKQTTLATTGLAGLGPSKVETRLLQALPPAIPLDQLSAQLFSKDFRLRDAVKMMRTDIPQIISRPDYHKLDPHQREKARQCMGERTKATTVGRGILRLASVPFNPTSRRTAPAVNLDTRESRSAAPVTFTVKDLNELEWPEFHSGVSSALEIAPGSRPIDTHWIFSHFYDEPNAHHAGFLVGLGLLGHLRSVSRVHAMRYIRPRHNLVTIGFSLGLAASSAGTGSAEARKLFSTQIAAFLPEGSASLNLPTAVQSAGMMAMGIVFLGSNHQWTAERLLQQVGATEIETADAQITDRECYSLSAGFGLGLTMLGKARRKGMRSLPDRHIVEQLRILIHGPPTGMFENEQPASEWRLDTNTTSIPATLALGLIYLRSSNIDAAEIITLPKSADVLDHIRPDQLMFRVIARALIMWSAIEPTEAWVMSVLPDFLRVPLNATGSTPGIMSFSGRCQLAWINMTAGACFALALRAAGTGNTTARNTLFHFHRFYTVQARVNCTAYFPKLRQAAFLVAADVVMSAMGIVMAGTGDLSTMRLMRVVHARIDQQSNYGSYMATHMALGMLFLGGGRFTLGRSDSAIAALLIAFYPHFPLTSSDNREHLQAYRHLWALAIEPRVVVAQDVDTNKLCYVPVEIAYAAKGLRPLQTTLPSNVSEFGRLSKISTASPQYWPAELDLRGNPRHAMALLLTRTLFVKRKKRLGIVDAEAEGAGGVTPDDAMDVEMATSMDASSSTSRELHELVSSFETAMHHGALFEHLASPSSRHSDSKMQCFRRTNANILTECLTLDKPNMIGIYLTLALLRSEWTDADRAFRWSPATSLQHRDLDFALCFYDNVWPSLFATRTPDGDVRQPVIQREVLDTVLQLMYGQVRNALSTTTSPPAPYLMARQALRDYLGKVGGHADLPLRWEEPHVAATIASLIGVPAWDHLAMLRQLHSQTGAKLYAKSRATDSTLTTPARGEWVVAKLQQVLRATLMEASDDTMQGPKIGFVDVLVREMTHAWKGDWLVVAEPTEMSM